MNKQKTLKIRPSDGNSKSDGEIAGTFDELLAKARDGCARHQYAVALALSVGHCVDRDTAEAVKWAELSARQEYIYALELLARLYAKGYAGASKKAQAEDWYRRAAERGHTRAAHQLGVMLAKRKDFDRAKVLLQQAAVPEYKLRELAREHLATVERLLALRAQVGWGALWA